MEQVDWQINKSSSECSKYMLENEVYCDISFKVGEDQEVIKAHNLKLRMRSPVFDCMFNGCFKESENDAVIPDVSPAAFLTLLRYCYYECLDIEGDVALSVLYAATKYMLPILERAARKTLIESLDGSTIWDACKYSTAVGDEELHAACITYLQENLSETNILDVFKYAVKTEHKELKACCRKHCKANLSESNILDIVKYVVSIGDEGLHATCKVQLREHLTGSNIWDIYKYALRVGDTEVHQYCREYFVRDVTTVREALQSEEFLNIQHEVLLDVLSLNDKVDTALAFECTAGISISEIELFTACDAWAQAECLRQKIDPTGANERTVLGECLSLIRFPTMLPKDLLIVIQTGILTQAGIVNLTHYMQSDPGAEYQADFPSKKRQFLVIPKTQTFTAGDISTVFVESEVRLLFSRVWTWWSGRYTVTVRDVKHKTSWIAEVDTKHGNHVSQSGTIVQYLDIEPPQVLEAGGTYTVTAEFTAGARSMKKHPGIRLPENLGFYKELKIEKDPNTNCIIYALTMSLV